MTIERGAQASTPAAQQALSAEHAASCGFDITNPPLLVGADVLAQLWSVSVSQIYRRIARNEFDVFRVRPAIGPKCFSGVLIARYIKGEPLYVPTFAVRKRA